MKLFLDTSTLIKLYHTETGSKEVEDLFVIHNITTIFISELSKVEFASAVWKKCRIKELTEAQVISLLQAFEADFQKFTFVSVDSAIIEQARLLLTKYGGAGLRTLDSLQLSTAIALQARADLFKTADELLESFFINESLPVA